VQQQSAEGLLDDPPLRRRRERITGISSAFAIFARPIALARNSAGDA
jgi:hypothetical protein